MTLTDIEIQGRESKSINIQLLLIKYFS